MNFQAFHKKIIQAIGRDQLTEAINDMKLLLEGSPHLAELIHQSARQNRLKTQIRQGTISHKEADITQNQIRIGLLELLDEIESLSKNNLNAQKSLETGLEKLYRENEQGGIHQTHHGIGDIIAGDKVGGNKYDNK